MKIKMDLKYETILEKIKRRFIREVLAEEGTKEVGGGEVVKADEKSPTQPEGDDPSNKTQADKSTIDFESLISKARQEEKSKLYPEIDRLKNELESKVNRINELLLTIGEKDETISLKDKELESTKADSTKSESEQVSTLNLKITELENIISQKDIEISNIKLEGYKEKKMAEAGGEIIPELVTGNSEEEIDEAVEKSKARYKEIFSKIASQNPPQVQQDSNNIPPANPNTNSFNEQLSAQNLADIDLFSKEGREKYQEMRKQMGLK